MSSKVLSLILIFSLQSGTLTSRAVSRSDVQGHLLGLVAAGWQVTLPGGRLWRGPVVRPSSMVHMLQLNLPRRYQAAQCRYRAAPEDRNHMTGGGAAAGSTHQDRPRPFRRAQSSAIVHMRPQQSRKCNVS